VELLLSAAQLPFAVVNFCFSHGKPSLLQAQALHAGIGALLTGVKEGLAVLGLLRPLPCVGKESVGVGPGLVQEVLSCPLCLFSSQGWVRRPNGGREPLARLKDDLHGLVVRPGQDLPCRLPRARQDFFGLLGRACADLLRLFPRLLVAFSHVLVQKAASLRGLVQKGPALIEARFVGGG
jgi:hypothetical protein